MKKYLIIVAGCFLFFNFAFAAKQITHTHHHTHTYRHPKKQKTLKQELPTTKNSVLEQRIKHEDSVSKIPFGIAFYKPTYVLPYYYTQKPAQTIYTGHTPDNQNVKSNEFKFQFSFQIPIWKHFIKKYNSWHIAYTQLSYWQFYTKSQYFRETDYEPEIYFSSHFLPNWAINLGAVHQSNGRGGEMERSWNRLYADLRISGKKWLISIKPWVLIFKANSSDLHNSDITKYMGHGRFLFVLKTHKQIVSIMIRNAICSGFRRGAVEAHWSFPLYGHFRGFVQFFTGYGQSLIEYNHYTNSAGIGIALSDWI